MLTRLFRVLINPFLLSAWAGLAASIGLLCNATHIRTIAYKTWNVTVDRSVALT